MTGNRTVLATSMFGALLLSAQPAIAMAAPGCGQLNMYYPILFFQSNNWGATLESPTRAHACTDPRDTCQDFMYGNVDMVSTASDNVKFIITWDNGSAGIYTGAIDTDGFVKGTTQDKWHPSSKADWHFENVMSCV
jgi:hypothetical protein